MKSGTSLSRYHVAFILLFFFQHLFVHAQGYRNFKVAIYCTVFDVEQMSDPAYLEKALSLLENEMHIDKVYLETHRRDFLIDENTLVKVKRFFEKRGIKTSGGITTTGSKPIADHFGVYCYTDQKVIDHLKEVVRFSATHFDEIIIDDFYFTSCRCSNCVEQKGERSWTEFRLELMEEISRDVVVKTAKEVNPEINMIIKYPNWYDFYQNTGYNLAEQPEIFDMIYTGT